MFAGMVRILERVFSSRLEVIQISGYLLLPSLQKYLDQTISFELLFFFSMNLWKAHFLLFLLKQLQPCLCDIARKNCLFIPLFSHVMFPAESGIPKGDIGIK